MKRISRPIMTTAALSLAVALLGTASSADVTIFQGQTQQSSGLKLLPWGSGSAEPSERYVFTGVNSIKVRTHGRYQGARLILDKPVPLSNALAEGNACLELSVLIADRETAGGVGRGPGGGMLGPGGMGGSSGGRPGQGGRGGSSDGEMGPGGMGGANSASQSLITEPKPIKNIRRVDVLSDGKTLDLLMPMEYAQSVREGWKTLSIPFSAIPALKSAEGSITEVRLFGDAVGTIYLGQIRTVVDATPIRVDYLPDRTVAVNDEVTFNGSAEAGSSQLLYQWTVLKAGEKLSPLPVDAEGKTFTHKFRKNGDYEVHLTVRDLYGKKQPVTTVGKVRVTL
ncbi:MAG: PKD domain-containing protein [Chthonomonadales bacterium]|nr:PKD domain-containing protein [Chthonomonadales bacterium]